MTDRCPTCWAHLPRWHRWLLRRCWLCNAPIRTRTKANAR